MQEFVMPVHMYNTYLYRSAFIKTLLFFLFVKHFSHFCRQLLQQTKLIQFFASLRAFITFAVCWKCHFCLFCIFTFAVAGAMHSGIFIDLAYNWRTHFWQTFGRISFPIFDLQLMVIQLLKDFSYNIYTSIKLVKIFLKKCITKILSIHSYIYHCLPRPNRISNIFYFSSFEIWTVSLLNGCHALNLLCYIFSICIV